MFFFVLNWNTFGYFILYNTRTFSFLFRLFVDHGFLFPLSDYILSFNISPHYSWNPLLRVLSECSKICNDDYTSEWTEDTNHFYLVITSTLLISIWILINWPSIKAVKVRKTFEYRTSHFHFYERTVLNLFYMICIFVSCCNMTNQKKNVVLTVFLVVANSRNIHFSKVYFFQHL